MLKLLAVILFLVGGWPSSQARGVYQLPALPDQNTFGSPAPYSFGYRTDSLDGGGLHGETSDGSGKVGGSYSWNVGDGREPYSADSAGFPAKVDGSQPGTGSHGPADVDFLSSTPEIGWGGNDGAPFQVKSGWAASPYFFQYSVGASDGESWRRESSDGAGRVRGSYGLKVEDGGSRKVDYTADASGFKAKVETSEPGTKSHRPADVSFYSSASDSTWKIPSISSSLSSATSHPASIPFQLASGSREAASPYSFDYTVDGVNGGSSRREWSDGSGNVKGSYSLKVKDGRSRKVDYTAGAEGFQATVRTNEPGTKSENPAGVSFLSSAPPTSSVGSSAEADIPASPTLPTASAHPFGVTSETESAAKPYSFAYTADGTDGGSSRAEWSDGTGKVKGHYSLKVKDGRRRKVDYTADAGGFRASVDTNEPGTKNLFPAEISFLSSGSEGTAGTPSAWSMGDGTTGEEPIVRPYNFDYRVEGADGASSGQEQSDGRGKVRGSYSFKLKDGRNRKVDYTADASGFRAEVETNEPGTGNLSPADVTFRSSAPTRPDFNSEAVPTNYLILAPSSPLTYQKVAANFPPTTSASPSSPSPYGFSYSVRAKDGGSSRREWSDGAGNVQGSYSLRLNDGRRRKVEYRADAGGFRASVDTNEPGTQTFYSAPHDPGWLHRPLTPPDQTTGDKSWV